MKEIASHKDLIVWTASIALAARVYEATRTMPREERFGLTQQLRRAAVSIPSNIAEGSARRNRREFMQFLHMARGSLAELETQLMIAIQASMVPPGDELLQEAAQIGRMLAGLIRSLSEQRTPASSFPAPTANRQPPSAAIAGRRPHPP